MGANYVTPTSLKATGIAMMILASLTAAARLWISFIRPKKFQWEDGWLLAAYVFFMAIAILYQIVSPTIFRLEALANGEIEPYPTIAKDGLFLQKIFFVVTSGLWFCLWCVKASLLALYKRLMAGVKTYIMLWWIVVGICFVFLVGAVTSSMLSCSSMKAWFTAGGCNTPRDVKAANISLWYAFAVDVVTDLMIMLLPIGLIWKLRMPLSQKLSIGGLFCLAWICIAVSIIRVKELGSTVTERSAPSTSWLALWGTVEAAIAVIIGCCPGLYRIAKQKYMTYKASYNRYGENYNLDSHGYAKYVGEHDASGGQQGQSRGHTRRNSHAGAGRDVRLSYIQSKASRVKTTVRGGGTYYDDGASSQEELATENKHRKSVSRSMTGNGEIMVTRSVTVRQDAERDGDSLGAEGIGVARWRD